MTHKTFIVKDYDDFIASQIPESAGIDNVKQLVVSIREQNTLISRLAAERTMGLIGRYISEEARKPQHGSTMHCILDSHSPGAEGPHGLSLGDAGNPVLVVTHAFSFKTTHFSDNLTHKHSLKNFSNKFRVHDELVNHLVRSIVGLFGAIIPTVPMQYFDSGHRVNQHVEFEEPGSVVQVVIQHSFNSPTFFKLKESRAIDRADGKVYEMLAYNDLNFQPAFDGRESTNSVI
jgi:hypothetical protein